MLLKLPANYTNDYFVRSIISSIKKYYFSKYGMLSKVQDAAGSV